MSLNTLTDAFARNARALFSARLGGMPTGAVRELAMEMTSSTRIEDLGWLGDLVGMTKEEGGSVILSNALTQSYSVENEAHSAAVQVNLDDLADDRAGIYTPMIQGMADEGVILPEALLGTLLTTAFTATDYTGTAFCTTSAKTPFPGASQTFTTQISGNPALTRDNARSAIATLKTRKNGRGNLMRLGRDLRLVVGPSLAPLAKEILEAEKVDGGDSNVDRGSAKVLEITDLTGSAANYWFIMEMGFSAKPLIMQWRQRPVLQIADDLNSSDVIIHNRMLMKIRARCKAAFGMSQLVLGSTGAGS
jgi:phage major head subunit gpT-like protein